jgi:hypothetical protein
MEGGDYVPDHYTKFRPPYNQIFGPLILRKSHKDICYLLCIPNTEILNTYEMYNNIATLVPEEKLHPIGRTKLVLYSDLTSRPPIHPPSRRANGL